MQGAWWIVPMIGTLISGAVACSAPPDRPTDTAREPVNEAADAPTDSPTIVPEQVTIDGMTQVLPAIPFESPLGFPLGFRTVVPADMAVDLVTSGRADAVRFEATFDGVRRQDVSLRFAVLPEGTDARDARRHVSGLVQALGATQRTAQVPEWATDAYDAVADTAAFLALGAHRDLWFYFLARYPAEFGDGMAPRIDLILRRWVWSDDGTPLRADQAP